VAVSNDRANHTRPRRWSPRRVGVVLLVTGVLTCMAAIPFAYGDGGARATAGVSPVVAALSWGGLLLLLAGGGVLVVGSIQTRRRRSHDQRH
jgi:hypothetical protein